MMEIDSALSCRIVRSMRTTVPLTETGFAPSQRVFKVAQLEELGVPQSVAYRRARAGGPWTRLAPGVVLVAPGPATVEDLIAAALLLAGPEAVVTGLHAARLHGMRSPRAVTSKPGLFDAFEQDVGNNAEL